MASKVQICNLALSKLGAGRITSLTDGSETANLCNTLFDDIADEVMIEGPWTSVIARAELAADATAPEYHFTHQFTLPTDPYCLRVLDINEDVPGQYEFKIEGRKLLSEISTMKIRYISRVEDTESFDAMLKRSIVLRLASELAYPLTGNRTLAAQLIEEYKSSVSNGLSVDGQQGSTEHIQTNDLTDPRFE